MPLVLETVNAKIDKTMLGTEDHGIFTAWIYVSGSGWCQGFGGFSLDAPRWSGGANRQGKFLGRVGTAYGMEFIRRVLDVLEIPSWERLPGQPVRIRRGNNGLIAAIGHYIKDQWFDPATDLAEFLPEEAQA